MGSLIAELLFELLVVTNSEGNVHVRPELFVNVIGVEPAGCFNGLVKQPGAFMALCGDLRQALLDHKFKVEPTHVDGIAGRSVKVTLRGFRLQLPVA